MFGNRTNDPARAAHVRAIKEWTAREVALDEDAAVMVTELQCTEPGCPPLETCVAVLRAGRSASFKVHKALIDVTEDDVVAGARRLS